MNIDKVRQHRSWLQALWTELGSVADAVDYDDRAETFDALSLMDRRVTLIEERLACIEASLKLRGSQVERALSRDEGGVPATDTGQSSPGAGR
jgi:hypothetical protein